MDKIIIIKNLIFKFPTDNINNHIFLSKYSEIEKILNTLDSNLTKFCYFYRKCIHQILYDEEEVIIIDKPSELPYFFYLSLLINDNINLVNYSYKFHVINELNNKNKNNNSITKIIYAKIIIDLINNFRGLDNSENDRCNKNIEDIKNENITYIDHHINIFQEKFDLKYNKDDFLNKKIDLIYIEIINALIIKRKLENYDDIIEIIKMLDLENIDITKTMYDKISEVLNSNEAYVTDYIISKVEDLKNIKKINFYYILIKYIIKRPIYIYNISLLLMTRKNIIKIVKEKLDVLASFVYDNNDIKTRMEFLLKEMLDSEYYYKKYKGNKKIDKTDIVKLKTILNYYENFLFESKANDIIALQDYLKNEKEIPNIDLKDLEDAEKYNERFPIINYFYNIKDENNKFLKKESQVKEDMKNWDYLEMMIKGKKTKKLKKGLTEKIFEYFIKENENYLIKLFDKEVYEFILAKKEEHINNNNYKNEIKINNDKINEIMNYYKQYYPESKKNDINEMEKIIENNSGDYDKYLNDYETAKKMNIRAPIIFQILKYENQEKPISENDINKTVNNWDTFENLIKENNTKDIPKESKKFLINYFKNERNEDTYLQIFEQKNIDNFIKDNKEVLNDIDTQKTIISENKISYNEQQMGKYSNNVIRLLPPNSNNRINDPSDEKLNKQNNASVSVQSINASTQIKTNIINSTITNKNDNIIIEEDYMEDKINDNYNKNIIHQLLTKSEINIHTNQRGKEQYIIVDEIFYGEHNISLSYKKFNDIKNYYKNNDTNSKTDLIHNFYLFIQFLEEFQNRIKKEFIYDYNLIIKINFSKIRENNIKNKNIYDISAIYIFIPPISINTKKSFKENNILINKTYSESQGFEFLLRDINQDIYKNSIYIEKHGNADDEETENISNSNTNNISISNISQEKNDETNLQLNKSKTLIENINLDKMKIIDFIKIMGKHEDPKTFCTAEFIKELSNGKFISGGTDCKLKIYNENFGEEEDEKIKVIDNIKEWTYNICEKTNFKEKKDNIIQFIVCSNKEIYLTDVSFDSNEKYIKPYKYELPENACTNCIEMKNNSFAMIGLNGSCYFAELFNKESKKIAKNIIINKTYRGGIRIKDNILALTSNSVAINGEDALIFYNHDKKTKKNRESRISSKIENFSFTFNCNGLALMPKDENKKNRILLCACKKYLSHQKNGILLVNPQLEDNHEVIDPFYDTKDFEVYCFCPIFELDPGNKVLYNEKAIQLVDTEYFFVGGFDTRTREGKIKLYKVIFAERAYNTKIKYLQDIEIQKSDILSKPDNEIFEGFDGAISSIIQSKYKGNILVSCYDGKIYLFSKPNLEYYKNKYNKEKKNIK